MEIKNLDDLGPGDFVNVVEPNGKSHKAQTGVCYNNYLTLSVGMRAGLIEPSDYEVGYNGIHLKRPIQSLLKLEKGECVIDVPLDGVTFRGICLGESKGKAYFKSDDGRYVIVNKADVISTDKNRVRINNKLDIRPNPSFISKKDKSIIEML